MKELAYPTNKSWEQFKGNWKNVVLGGLSYLAKHPIRGPGVILPRLQFALQKKNLDHPVKTPEGFTLLTNSELLVYTNIFTEQNLRHGPMLRDFKDYPNPVVVDVGFNCGFVSKWLYGINNTAIFYGVEVMAQHIERSREMEREMYQHSYYPVDNVGWAPTAFVYHNAGWSSSGKKVQIAIGDQVNVSQVGQFEIATLAIDDIKETQKQPIFLLKIDTDGSNIEVLKGASGTLQRCYWLLIEEEPGVIEYCQEALPGWEMARLTRTDLVFRNRKLIESVWRDRFKLWSR